MNHSIARPVQPVILFLCVLGAAFLAVGLLAGTAGAQTGYPGGATITAPAVITPCQSGVVTGSNFPPNSAGSVTVGSSTVPFTTGPDGRFTATVSVPCSASPGQTLVVTASAGGTTATTSIQTGAAIATTNLPLTGSSPVTAVLARVGIALAAVGAALWAIAANRRRAAVATPAG